MKKLKLAFAGLIYFGLISGAFIAMPSIASAALTESQIQAILSLLQSFGADQTVVGNVNSSLRGLPTTGGGGGTIAFCPNFTYNLYLGLNDSETEAQVSQLQKFLAQDSSVYPEGTITGFYGPLTEQAVKRWQAQQGVVSSGSPDTTGYGVVGSRTREKIRANCGFPTPVPPTPIPPRSSNLSPVISGVSGPTTLNTGQSGTWTVTARDPENSPLSYSVIWGDESEFAAPSSLRAPSPTEPVKQTATFTHTYYKSGVYTPVFYVTDIQGLSAKTSISVNVGSTVVTQGSLYLSPSSLSVAVGSGAGIQALYQPPMPPCLAGAYCARVMPASYPVSAKWVSSNSAIASVGYKDITTAVVSGISVGTAEIKAVYTESSGNVLSATAKVNVTSTPQPSITVLSPNGGESWPQGSLQTIRWSAPSSSSYVSISLIGYSKPCTTEPCPLYAVQSFTLGKVLASGGYFNWTVGKDINGYAISSGQYLLQITDTTTNASDQSNAPFSITSQTQPSVKITYPLADSTLTNKSVAVSGTCSNYSGAVDVFYYSDKKEETFVQCISGYWSTNISVNSNAGSGSFDLYAQLYPNNTSVQDIIKLYFNWLSAPSITVLSPNGGESWTMNSSQTIKWVSHGTHVTISLVSLDKTKEVYGLLGSIPNDGSETMWLPSDLPLGQYYLRVRCVGSCTASTQQFDDSDAPFSIVAPSPDLVVTSFSVPTGTLGQTVNASATILNQGSASTGSGFRIEIDYSYPPDLPWNCSYASQGSANTDALAAGASRTVSIPVTLPTTRTGSFDAVVMADSDCAISESNEDNNFRSVPYTVSSIPTTALYANVFEAAKPLWWPTSF